MPLKTAHFARIFAWESYTYNTNKTSVSPLIHATEGTMSAQKYVAYFRVSTQRQGASGLGLDAQRATVANFLNGGRHELLGEFCEVETGKGNAPLTKRPQLAAALALCKKTNARLLIAKLDRLARNVHFISGLMESKIKFTACDLPECNELVLHMMAAFAEYEAKRISERTRDALRQAKLRGVVLGRMGPVNLKPNIEQRMAAADEFAGGLAPVLTGFKQAGLTQLAMVEQLNLTLPSKNVSVTESM
jgi:DNA invertase Pin-like site-specific DNA recombinase